jgi:hypothetical protein
MTVPLWDIPGVPHDVQPPAAGDVLLAAPGTGLPASRGSRARAVSSSALAGSSTGAFTSTAADVQPPTHSLASPPVAGFRDDDDGVTSTAAITAADPVQALAFVEAGLEYLAHANSAEWPAGLQADCLRALAVAEARQAAAHAKVLAAFSVPGGGLAGDGHASPRVWLTWQTQATRRAATTHVARMKDLHAHPRIAAALAGGQISLSWARQLTDWSSRLPAGHRDQADAELLAAAGRGAGLADLHGIAQELRREHAEPDTDDDDGFADRGVRFATTFGGAGRIEGDLTARCAAAVDAVLGSLAARRGPEDTRTAAQRQHDALEEACTRLLAADCLPERAGQPVRLELPITLDELARNGDRSPAGPGAGCDAVIQPVITGLVDHQLLQRLTDPGYRRDLADAARSQAASDRFGLTLEQAIALLSGPAGRAAWLRRRAGGPAAAAISLPLDIAGTFDTIPVHLRRAVRKRDRHCRFPGCDLPPAACDVHHLTHRKDGGRHSLTNLALFCRFHHLVAIHRWGWHVTLHPDGTTTAISPDGTKTLHSHPPPVAA